MCVELLVNDVSREISVRYSGPSASIEIYSRPRFGPDEWTLHARGRPLRPQYTSCGPVPPRQQGTYVGDTKAQITSPPHEC